MADRAGSFIEHNYYADLHIHIGRSPWGGPVKVTAAASLTVEGALRESAGRKGLDLIGIVDAQTCGGLAEIKTLIDRGILAEQPGGGFAYTFRPAANERSIGERTITLIAGAEVETRETVNGSGRLSHWLVLVRDLKSLQALNQWYISQVTNPNLSSQRVRTTAAGVQRLAADLGGLFIPAHVFTPFKSLYGRCADSWTQVLNDRPHAVELGLSADSLIADRVPELSKINFLSHSDAHSLPKIAREYTVLGMASKTFDEFRLAVAGSGRRRVIENFGLDPRLGKYYRSYCRPCGQRAAGVPPVEHCARCGNRGSGWITGVLDRICQFGRIAPQSPPWRAPYRHQVPLEFIPGLGKQRIEQLLSAFGSEMQILHQASSQDLAEVVPASVAQHITRARRGPLDLVAGGGGKYGRVAGPPVWIDS